MMDGEQARDGPDSGGKSLTIRGEGAIGVVLPESGVWIVMRPQRSTPVIKWLRSQTHTLRSVPQVS